MNDKKEEKKRKAGAPPAPPNETAAARFKRIAGPRTSRAIAGIDVLSNLASAQYEYTPEQVNKMLAALRASVDHLERVFADGGKKKGSRFSFD